MRHRGPDPRQVRQMALEIRRVGQYAEARRAVLLVGPRDRHRVEIGPDDLRRGAGLLDLGDELDRAGPDKRRAEIADRRGRRRLVLELLQRHPPPRRGHLATLGRNDLIQDGCLHQPVVSRLLPQGLQVCPYAMPGRQSTLGNESIRISDRH